MVDIVADSALACWSRGNLTTASLKASWLLEDGPPWLLVQIATNTDQVHIRIIVHVLNSDS